MNKKNNPIAFILHCHYNGLSIIRDLGRRGVPVLAVDTKRNVGCYSRYAKYVQCPDPAHDESGFIDFVYHLAAQQEQKPVLIPTGDAWAMAISKHKKKLEEVAIPCVANWETVEMFLNKPNFIQWCQKHSFPVPDCWHIREADRIPANRYPLALKPIARRKSSDNIKNLNIQGEYDRNRLVMVETHKELKLLLSKLHGANKHYFLQEYVPGLSDSMYTVGVYVDRSSQLKGAFSGHKLRGHPADVGDWRLGEVKKMPDEVIELVGEICRDSGFHGIAEFEFKHDHRKNEYRLIEINPRSWSWVGITAYCGINLPWMAYADLAGIEEPRYTRPSVPDGSVKYVRLLEDARNCLFRYKREGYPEWSLSFRRWLGSLKAEKLVTIEFAKDDLMPGIIAAEKFILSIIYDLVKSISEK
jgi:predicted ATP-grasp superfamily ATP-dependent carboligase